MTATTLTTDRELRWALTGPDGVPLDDPDPRLPVWRAAGWIEARGDRWRWQPRRPSPLTGEQRAYVAADVAYERRCCDV